MPSLNDDYDFCGGVCVAAARMGIAIRETQENEKYGYIWLDMVTGSPIPGPLHDSKKDALKGACEALIDYLALKPNKVENEQQSA